MKINQLFTSKVDIQFVIQLLKCFDLSSLQDKKTFSKFDIIQNNTVQKVAMLIPQIETYYLPCKAKIYLLELNEKRVITILKQILRLHGYYLASKERNYNNSKITFYQVIDEKDKMKSNNMKTYQITNILNFS